jgi:hypothetical protein
VDVLRNVLPANFERYLRGIDFPIGKQELLRKLKQNGAPSVVVDQVGKRLPEGQYRSPQDLVNRLKGWLNPRPRQGVATREAAGSSPLGNLLHLQRSLMEMRARTAVISLGSP